MIGAFNFSGRIYHQAGPAFNNRLDAERYIKILKETGADDVYWVEKYD